MISLFTNKNIHVTLAKNVVKHIELKYIKNRIDYTKEKEMFKMQQIAEKIKMRNSENK